MTNPENAVTYTALGDLRRFDRAGYRARQAELALQPLTDTEMYVLAKYAKAPSWFLYGGNYNIVTERLLLRGYIVYRVNSEQLVPTVRVKTTQDGIDAYLVHKTQSRLENAGEM